MTVASKVAAAEAKEGVISMYKMFYHVVFDLVKCTHIYNNSY